MRPLSGDRVQRHVTANALTVYRLVSDVPRTPEWSPQVQRCEWVAPATGPAGGARFRATNGARGHRWSNVPVVEVADPGREFAFVRRTPGGGTIRWRYVLEPDADGTLVTESYEVLQRVPWALHAVLRLFGVRNLAADLRANLRISLDRIAAIAEREAAGR